MVSIPSNIIQFRSSLPFSKHIIPMLTDVAGLENYVVLGHPNWADLILSLLSHYLRYFYGWTFLNGISVIR